MTNPFFPAFILILLLATPAASFAEEPEVDIMAYRLTLPILDADPVNVPEEKKAAAESLYRQALEAARNRQGYEAMRLIIQTLETDPDHEAARKIMGHKRHKGKWRTDWEIRQLESGYVDHERFGWLPGEFMERYEAGRRYYAPEKRWVDADEDARLHFEMRNAWVISTEHYDVRTNHSWEEGVRTARKLEHLNRAWRLLFFNMVFTESRLARHILEPPRIPPKQPRHRVLVYRDQADYNANLIELEPRIERSIGFYFPQTATAYFFPVPNNVEPFEADAIRKTMLHEATHQLFQNAKSSRNQNPPRINYWVTEGVAMLMETFRIDRTSEQDRYIIGDLFDIRLLSAKVYFERDHYFVPSARLTHCGEPDFPKEIKCYSQSAGLTHFLMFENDGKDRDALLELLRKTYDGSARADTLEKLLGRSYEELDKEYQAFLRIVP